MTRPIAFYYGAGEVDRLSGFDMVVLQADFYSRTELDLLRERGVRTLGYLSLTEDVGPPAPWHREERNPDWGGAFVHVGDPRWVAHVVDQAVQAMDKGFHGLFLDTLNIEHNYPDDLPHLLLLIAAVQEEARPGYLLANRGFGLLPELADLVDGVLFESFSARWVDTESYAPWPDDVLEAHATVAERLLGLGLDLYALDYADSDELTDFACRRAREFGMLCFVSDRVLSRI
ncbi:MULTISPECIES: endo alpha-1,4 polygalactosaminidase [Nonomuraea]|uniref:Endo alpha-1,4 polygalactosaminidase n=1 Tax=Nonomuraea ferruginea TaxID=46174 RepID=A0ABT4TBM6_9ACTN|nr:endo alpha-1,4 polygalactosaminidase [Nonomuraea ferruginea]MDA0646669.1 endo alpha-1,4 polygalactosaminidase [Nonomuraea ferruginea]